MKKNESLKWKNTLSSEWDEKFIPGHVVEKLKNNNDREKNLKSRWKGNIIHKQAIFCQSQFLISNNDANVPIVPKWSEKQNPTFGYPAFKMSIKIKKFSDIHRPRV